MTDPNTPDVIIDPEQVRHAARLDAERAAATRADDDTDTQDRAVRARHLWIGSLIAYLLDGAADAGILIGGLGIDNLDDSRGCTVAVHAYRPYTWAPARVVDVQRLASTIGATLAEIVDVPDPGRHSIYRHHGTYQDQPYRLSAFAAPAHLAERTPPCTPTT